MVHYIKTLWTKDRTFLARAVGENQIGEFSPDQMLQILIRVTPEKNGKLDPLDAVLLGKVGSLFGMDAVSKLIAVEMI